MFRFKNPRALTETQIENAMAKAREQAKQLQNEDDRNSVVSGTPSYEEWDARIKARYGNL